MTARLNADTNNSFVCLLYRDTPKKEQLMKPSFERNNYGNSPSKGKEHIKPSFERNYYKKEQLLKPSYQRNNELNLPLKGTTTETFL